MVFLLDGEVAVTRDAKLITIQPRSLGSLRIRRTQENSHLNAFTDAHRPHSSHEFRQLVEESLSKTIYCAPWRPNWDTNTDSGPGRRHFDDFFRSPHGSWSRAHAAQPFQCIFLMEAIKIEFRAFPQGLTMLPVRERNADLQFF